MRTFHIAWIMNNRFLVSLYFVPCVRKENGTDEFICVFGIALDLNLFDYLCSILLKQYESITALACLKMH